ncbi:trimeric intracellular cation channel family protein [Paralimibaculum aggregatum]|uniref:Trimeric intracellular cation channel family protein n=1 Tax=Paralimibaculum aggregatum TaxID=3036245 RepID=A0ABQ6LL40_9RHOB|nr:TRIC cation channel family protein [Limibaculum sp. NKW23]GMG83943.1 trimeric intracellular cation channel family protein [Limibaculum sp. NKW23]
MEGIAAEGWALIPVLSLTVSVLTVIATAVLAASAALQAARCGFDAFGAVALAAAASLGGGTVRDLLLGATPVFWLRDITYLATAAPVGLGVFLFADRVEGGTGKRLRLLLYLDALGLALFTLVGIAVARQAGVSEVMAVALGCITGVTGGILRDLLCGQPPLVLREDLYASVSLAGGALFMALDGPLPAPAAEMLAFAVMVAARFLVLWRQRRQPPG